MHTKLLFSLFALVLGAAIIFFGGYDDSPGAQLIGLLVVLAGIVGILKNRNRS